LKQPIDCQSNAANGVMAHPGAGAMVAKLETPAAHHLPLAAYQCKTNRARSGDNDTAIAPRKCAHAGSKGIIVSDDCCKWQIRGFNFLGTNGRDDSRNTHSGMKAAGGKASLSCSLPGRCNYCVERAFQVLIDIGSSAHGLAKHAAVNIANARAATAAAAINAKKARR
jgi:hypothetical protein